MSKFNKNFKFFFFSGFECPLKFFYTYYKIIRAIYTFTEIYRIQIVTENSAHYDLIYTYNTFVIKIKLQSIIYYILYLLFVTV